jgi:hypothetical protein
MMMLELLQELSYKINAHVACNIHVVLQKLQNQWGILE